MVVFCALAIVTLSVLVPPTRFASAASVGLGSLDARWTSSVVETGFQFASVELTVTLNAVPAVCALGAPVLPEPLPGAAVSPGSRICSLLAAPALTVIDELEGEVVSTSPLVRAAVSVSDSAFVYWTVPRTTELVPAPIVPVLPESVPVPDGASDTPVPATTLAGLLPTSCD